MIKLTTQEKIAKHLGVSINEPFVVSGWNHKPFHVDPNLGVVTHDGDKVSNVMLQEILFGDGTITKTEKQKFFIPFKHYINIENTFIRKEIQELVKNLETLDKYTKFEEAILESSQQIADEYKGETKYIYQFEDFFNECSADTERMIDCCRLDQYFSTTLAYYVEEELTSHIHTVAFNILAKYVHEVGIITSKSQEEVIKIIENIADNTLSDIHTPQSLINLLEVDLSE